MGTRSVILLCCLIAVFLIGCESMGEAAANCCCTSTGQGFLKNPRKCIQMGNQPAPVVQGQSCNTLCKNIMTQGYKRGPALTTQQPATQLVTAQGTQPPPQPVAVPVPVPIPQPVQVQQPLAPTPTPTPTPRPTPVYKRIVCTTTAQCINAGMSSCLKQPGAVSGTCI